MNILFATSEVHPLIKTGGLADVSGSLPKALKALKNHVRIVLPAYRAVLDKVADKSPKHIGSLLVGGCGRNYHADILEVQAKAFPSLGVPVWLVDIPELFDRPGNPYIAADGSDWWDNGERFAVFSKVVAQISMDRAGIAWKPDVVHTNDWQTGLVNALLSLEVSRPKTVFTIHNMAYPGNYPESLFAQLELDWSLWQMQGVEFWGHFSMLKAGLIYADRVTTVSPTYAQEICHHEFAYGFEGILQDRAAKGHLVGILNGIDNQTWNPQLDEFIEHKYSAEKGRVAAKQKNKAKLLRELSVLNHVPEYEIKRSFDEWLHTPLIGLVGRLVYQKGVDLILDALPFLLENTEANFVFVGSGDKYFEQRLLDYSQHYPKRIWTYIGYSEKLGHEVEAGADMFLMPSRFEPCGLNQLYSLAYGTPPIVHSTGGLADSVVSATNENLKNGLATGFVFYEKTPQALQDVIQEALALFAKKRTWQKLQKHGMLQNFDWQLSAEKYLSVYQGN